MRILADENVPGPIVFRLRELGHDTTWVLTDYPSLKDPQILELAESQARIVLTLGQNDSTAQSPGTQRSD